MNDAYHATRAASDSPSFALADLWRAALRRRRVRIWTPVLLVLTAALLVGVLAPSWSWLPAVGLELPASTVLFVFLAALLCEFVDSSLGMGYGTALTPLLLWAGFEPRDVVPCVLLSECITGFVAGMMHHRDGNVDLRRDPRARSVALALGLLSGLGAIAAVSVTVHISKYWLTTIIGLIILSMGLIILATLRTQLRFRLSHLLAVGVVAAFNKGLSGGGYGPLITAGQVVSGVSPKQAVGITSLAEAVTCLVGLAAYLALQRSTDWSLAIPLVSGALLSVPFATLTIRRLPGAWVRGVVGVVTLVLGGALLMGRG